MKHRFWKNNVLTVAICATVAISTTSCRVPEEKSNVDQQKTLTQKQQYRTPVVSATATLGTIQQTLPTTGSLVALETSSLVAEEGGRLTFPKPWKEGDVVQKGDLIATIDSPEILRELELNTRDVRLQDENIDIGKRTYNARKRDFDTLQDLYSQGISAEKEVDSARLELERAENNLKQNQINLEKAKVRLAEVQYRMESLEVRAPYKSVLVTASTLRGEGNFQKGFGSESLTEYEGRYVSKGHLVCGVYDGSSFVMRTQITPRDISEIEVGQTAKIEFFTKDQLQVTGTVSEISKSVQPDTRAFNVDVKLDDVSRAYSPGLFGRAEIVTKQKNDAIVIPKEALTRRQNRTLVFVVERGFDDPEKAVAREIEVTVGLEGIDAVEILEGIGQDVEIIQRGFEVLQDGTPVQTTPIEEIDLAANAAL